jgi:hypothetical protein
MTAYGLAENVESVRFGLTVIAGIVGSLGVIFGAAWKVGLGKFIRRWQTRRKADWAASIAAVVKPMVDGARAAALEQHDEQNLTMEQGFMSVHKRIDELEVRIEEGAKSLVERIDKGAEHLAHHDVEIAVLQARPSKTRARSTDI